MKKKILYTIGGIFILFTTLAIIGSNVESDKIQDNKVVTTEIENVSTTSTTAETKNTTTSDAVSVTETKTQPVTKPVQTSPQYTYYSVTDVVDGDTIKINKDGQEITLRLIGMDTPETVDPRKPVQCFGKEASNKTKELLSGKKVRIETDPTQGELDKYGRTLAYVYRDDGLFYNKYMIEQGYAHEYTYNTPYKYQVEFKSAQKSAQTAQIGLWSPDTCNGDTTSSGTANTTTQSSAKYYTSSYYSSKYYYPESCDGWKSLSENYLKSFNSLEELLAQYPSKTLSPQCI